MCNSGTCPYEVYGGPDVGDCGKRPGQICPESYETEEECEDARKEAENAKY